MDQPLALGKRQELGRWQELTIRSTQPKENIGALPSQSLVRIKSVGDGRSYLGAVVKGPFAEPDGLRADAPVVVTATVRGGIFMPKYHGRVQVELIGEELTDGGVVPPRRRPLPNSPVFALTSDETAGVLRTGGDVRLGVADGQEDIEVTVPSASKSVLPRHTGHKVNDSNVASRLRRSIGGIDAALWDRLPNLAPGQAIVSFTSLARPLLVAIDPTPCKLQMVE
ncbi:MAG: hypothetical protein Kow0010_15140 [Dehalococcoidia bacterium]